MERKVIFENKAYSLVGQEKKVGDIAEDFLVVNTDLEYTRFSDLPKGVKIISSCTSVNSVMCALQNKRLNAEVFVSTKGITALSISVDLPFTQQRFSFEEDVEYITFLSDYKGLDFGYKYGLVIEELKMLSRAIFVIDQDNIIRHVEYVKDNVDQFNYLEVIKVTKSLQ